MSKTYISKLKQTFLFCLLYAGYTSIYLARMNLSVAGPEFLRLNRLDAAQIGILGSCFCIVFAAGRLLNGILSDFIHPRFMIGFGLVLTGLCNLFISFFPFFTAMLPLWLVNAYAQSMLWSSVLFTVSSMYEKNTAKKKMSIMITSVAAGNILGILVNSRLIADFGIAFAFAVPGLCSMLLGVLVFFSLGELHMPQKTDSAPAGLFDPSGDSSGNLSGNSAMKGYSPIGLFGSQIRALFSGARTGELLAVNATGVLHGIMKENVSLWMAVYIADTYFVDLTTSSYYLFLVPSIGFLGRICYPFFYKLCKEREHIVSMIGFGACIAASLLLSIGGTGILGAVLALSAVYMAVSIINTSLLSIYPLSYSETGNAASVSGIIDFSTYLGAGIASLFYGILIQHCGYLPMFLSWIVLSAVSLILLHKIQKAS